MSRSSPAGFIRPCPLLLCTPCPQRRCTTHRPLRPCTTFLHLTMRSPGTTGHPSRHRPLPSPWLSSKPPLLRLPRRVASATSAMPWPIRLLAVSVLELVSLFISPSWPSISQGLVCQVQPLAVGLSMPFSSSPRAGPSPDAFLVHVLYSSSIHHPL